jgi:Programmed cell death protein 2, C-terminal putative domain
MSKASSQQKSTGKAKLYGQEQPIPPCDCCGTPRVFEMQLLPSLLHVLEVDKHVKSDGVLRSGGANPEQSTLATAYESGGMDWGNIAVYTCPNASCVGEVIEYCVVQDSVDESPTVPIRAMHQEDVIIQEGSKFEDDDEEDECEGIIEDNEDDGSVW